MTRIVIAQTLHDPEFVRAFERNVPFERIGSESADSRGVGGRNAGRGSAMTQRCIKSAERTLRLFELFARRQERLTVTEIERGLAIPQPSASMLLSNLAALGYLDYDRFDRSYAPTVRAALLGGWIGPRLPGPQSLASRLDDLHRSVGEYVFVGIQNGAYAQVVQTKWGSHDLSIDSGQMFSLTCTAIGQVLLASKADTEALRLVRRCNAEEPESRFRVDEVSFMTVLEEVRRNGYAVTTGRLPGRRSIAVPVSFRSGRVPFGIGVAGPIDHIETKRELILQGLRAFQTATLESDVVPADGLGIAAVIDDRSCA